MGGIHKGHVSLIKISQKNNKETIVSIFVNPTQFNQKKDFKNYPRNIRKDISILKKLKVNYLFLPEVNEIYKNKMKNFKLNKLFFLIILLVYRRLSNFLKDLFSVFSLSSLLASTDNLEQ